VYSTRKNDSRKDEIPTTNSILLVVPGTKARNAIVSPAIRQASMSAINRGERDIKSSRQQQ
jgi:hypothetical protein